MNALISVTIRAKVAKFGKQVPINCTQIQLNVNILRQSQRSLKINNSTRSTLSIVVLLVSIKEYLAVVSQNKLNSIKVI